MAVHNGMVLAAVRGCRCSVQKKIIRQSNGKISLDSASAVFKCCAFWIRRGQLKRFQTADNLYGKLCPDRSDDSAGDHID